METSSLGHAIRKSNALYVKMKFRILPEIVRQQRVFGAGKRGETFSWHQVWMQIDMSLNQNWVRASLLGFVCPEYNPPPPQ